MILYGFLLVCAFLAAVLVVRYDLYDREPLWMLALTACAGACAMWGLSHLEDWSIKTIDPGRPVWAMALVAATHEEGARLILVFIVSLLSRRHFNDPMDGLVYGSMAGLGMAAFESWLYVPDIPSGEWVMAAPELVRIFGHLSLGGIACFGLGLRRMQMRRWPTALMGCFAAAVAMHFIVDYVGLNILYDADAPLWMTAVVALAMVAGLLFYGVLTRLGGEWSRQVFRPDALPNLLVVPWSAWTSPLPDASDD